jgi:flagella basal body P-ring formation protein FlgA
MPLGPDNCALSRERVSQTTGLYLTSVEQALGLIAKRSMQPNQLVMLSDAGQPALIHRGDIVTVVLTKGRVKVETRGVANNDAGRGETVMVTSASTRTQLTGVAEASGTVVVRN